MDNRHFEILMGAIDKLDTKLDRKLDKIDERIAAQDEEIDLLTSKVSSYEHQAKGAWRIVSVLAVVASGAFSTLLSIFKP